MLTTLIVTAITCFCSLGLILVIPYFGKTKLVMRFLPKDIQAAAQEHPDPAPGRLLIGYLLTLVTFFVFVGGYVFLGADGLRRGCGFWALWGRFMVALYGYKLFDILVQDQYIIITRQYFVKFYPETKNCLSWHDRSFNTKNQLIRLIAFPFAAMLMAAITLWIGG